jgi:SAM-dependent methyltransferase
VILNINKHIDPDFTIKNALDFGCGVGRLVIPLSSIAETVTGLDVSDSMLKEAQKNCDDRFIKNVQFFKSDDELSSLTNKYDFIHSVIVFQHIPTKRGEIIFKNMIEHIEEGGIAVIHLTYSRNIVIRSVKDLIVAKTKGYLRYLPFSYNFSNIIRGKSFFYPQMQMNHYDLNNIFYTLQLNNIVEIYTEYTNHGGELGIILYFKKPETGCRYRKTI